MTITRALTLITAGGRARRRTWAEGTYLYLSDQDKQIKCRQVGDTSIVQNNYAIHKTDVLAQDWEDFTILETS